MQVTLSHRSSDWYTVLSIGADAELTATNQEPSMSDRIGVISDTHGLMRPEAILALQGSSVIIHAGDIGSDTVLRVLEKIAPVYAVRGNNDTAEWASTIPHETSLTIGGIVIHIVHDIADLRLKRAAGQARVVVAGHSHRPLIDERGGILYINPGSAGPRRFRLPVSVARLDIRNQHPIATLIELNCVPSGSHGTCHAGQGATRESNRP